MDIERNRQIRHHNHPPPTYISSFTKCCCSMVRMARFLPFILISTLYIWGICVYMYYVVYSYYETLWIQLLLAIIVIPLYLLSFISYIKCVFARHRAISAEFYIPETIHLNEMTEDEINNQLELVIQQRNLPIFTRSYNGYVRYCQKCLVLKPDRAHHCSTCGKCICKMDHHCHWVSNCVAFDNYKYFILFLSYTSIMCIYCVLTSIELFKKFWRDENFPGKFPVFFLVLLCFIFSLSIAILLVYHIYLVSKNCTTLESYQTPRFRQYEYDYYRFNLGCKRNFIQVFGDNKWYWILPIFNSLGDGHCYQLPLIPGVYDKNNSLTVCDVTNSSYPPALLQQQQQQSNNI